jgi:hypothetical protein
VIALITKNLATTLVLMKNALRLITICCVMVFAFCATPANAKGSGDKFGDAQVGLTYGVYMPTRHGEVGCGELRIWQKED